MNVTIVPARVSDARQICYVQNQGWLSAHVNESLGITRELILSREMESEEKVANRAQQIRNCGANMQSWVAIDSDNVVGWCVATKSEKGHMIEALYVLPEYHGKGIGTQLVTIALSWLGDTQAVSLNVATYNERAICFYQKHGFFLGRDSTLDFNPYPEGQRMPSREMIRPVKPV